MPQIHVFAQDRDGRPLQHSNISAFIGEDSIGRVDDSRGQADFSYDGAPVPIRVKAEYQGQAEERTLAADQDTIEIRFPNIDLGSSLVDLLKQNIPALIGALLLIAALVLGFVFSQPNGLQTFLIRASFALGAAGVASVFTGFLNVNWGLGSKFAVSAGGGLAVLVLIYVVSPSDLSDSNSTAPVRELSRTPAENVAPGANAAGTTNAVGNKQ